MLRPKKMTNLEYTTITGNNHSCLYGVTQINKSTSDLSYNFKQKKLAGALRFGGGVPPRAPLAMSLTYSLGRGRHCYAARAAR